MESDPAEMPKKHMIISGMNTTLPSGAKPFYVSTVSDSEQKESTDSDLILPNGLTVSISADMERFFTSWLEESEFLISEYSVSMTMNPCPKKNSNNGSTGLSPEEVEP